MLIFYLDRYFGVLKAVSLLSLVMILGNPYVAWASYLGRTTSVAEDIVSSPLQLRALKKGADEQRDYRLADYKRWGLNEKDWHKYQSLMLGPRGLWTPNLDPILVLGVHAVNAAERERFAKVFVTMELARMDAEVRFQRAVNHAIEQQSGLDYAKPFQGRHLVLFASLSCERDCTDLLTKAQSIVTREDARLFIYLSGAVDDHAVRGWALERRIKPLSVHARRIQLDHDKGRWQRARESHTHLATARLPQLLTRDGNGNYGLL